MHGWWVYACACVWVYEYICMLGVCVCMYKGVWVYLHAWVHGCVRIGCVYVHAWLGARVVGVRVCMFMCLGENAWVVVCMGVWVYGCICMRGCVHECACTRG